MMPPETPESSKRDDEPAVQTWARFFRKYAAKEAREAVLDWPQKRSLVIDWFDVDRHDSKLAERLLTNPTQSIAQAEEALKLIDLPVLEGGVKPRLHVRVTHLPDEHRFNVRDLRAEHLGQLIAIPGLIRRASETRPKVQDALFQCGRCGSLIREAQEEHLVLKEPLECYEDQGGCRRDSTFKLIVTETRGQSSRFVDNQKLEVQEPLEGLRGGEQPQRLVLFAEDDLCGKLRPGERVTVNGILRSSVRKDGGVKTTLFDMHLEVNSVERAETDFEDVKLTDEEVAHIERFARDPGIYEKMRDGIAPSIHGLQMEKLALLFQLFGGVEKTLPDGTRLRGDIHVLLVGDPGVAKSQLLRFMYALSPRAIKTTGRGTSSAGLTATTVKDDFGEGRWTLEAGAMVLADRGLVCVDEIDKLRVEDQSSMHEAMEQQSISVAKAGITATLLSRCSVLAAANPKAGRFDLYTPLGAQINFPPALLSRFDVIFPIRDLPTPEGDRRLADHIVGGHVLGAKLARAAVTGDKDAQEDAEAALLAYVPPLLAEVPKVFQGATPAQRFRDFLRKYVAHAKHTCVPVVTPEAHAKLVNYFVGLRNSKPAQLAPRDAGGGAKARPAAREGDDAARPMPLTARQLESLVRLAEASARVRLAAQVTLEDAQRAFDVYEYFMNRVGAGDGGGLDVDRHMSPVSFNQREQAKDILADLDDLCTNDEDAKEHGASFRLLLARASARGIGEARLEQLLAQLVNARKVRETAHQHYKRT